HHYLGARLLAWAQRDQHVVELRRVVVHWQDGRALEQFGEHAFHHLAVLEHVRHAGGHAQVVLEHVHRAVLVADQVRAADVRPGTERWFDAPDGRAEVLGRLDDGRRHHSILDELLPVVDIVDEQVQRRGALPETRLDLLPFLARDGAWNDVEWPGAV